MKKILGFTESVNVCDCCGKQGLKGTFVVDIDGTYVYYGSTCAVKKHDVSKKEAYNATTDAKNIAICVNRWINKYKIDSSKYQEMYNHLLFKKGSLTDFLTN